MNNKTKNILIIIGAVLLLGGGMYFYFNRVEDDKVGRLKRNLAISKLDIIHYKNRVGELTAEVEAKRYTRDEFADFEKETMSRINEIAGDVKAVRQYVKFKSSVKDTVFIKTDSTVYIVDKSGEQVKEFPFSFQDKYMELNGKIEPEGTTIDYEYRPVYEVVASWKKPEGAGLFAKNRLLVDVVAENPKEIITEAQAIEVDVPKKSFFNSKAFWSGLAYIVGIITNIVVK